MDNIYKDTNIDAKYIQELGADGRPAGVEEEEAVALDYPFDPEQISITSQTVHLAFFLDRMKAKEIYAPPLQRSDNVWTLDRQSRLIESLMLKIPLPLFYVASDKDENWAVIDGLQRITAIDKFINKADFALSGLEYLNDFNGCKFNGLPAIYQNRIKNTQLQFAIIGSKTPSEVQRNIFKRLNTGGMPLSPQEIRHALYHGKSAQLLSDLANSKEFKEATNSSIAGSRMADRELVLRFIAFLLHEPTDYPANSDMDAFLSKTMQTLNKMDNFDEISKLFKQAMKRGKLLFADHAFRKSNPTSKYKAPVNKAIFDSVGVILANMPETHFRLVLNKKKNIYKTLTDSLSSNSQLERSISRDSNKRSGVIKRFRLFRKLFDSI